LQGEIQDSYFVLPGPVRTMAVSVNLNWTDGCNRFFERPVTRKSSALAALAG
jgi:hypothetical protein